MSIQTELGPRLIVGLILTLAVLFAVRHYAFVLLKPGTVAVVVVLSFAVAEVIIRLVRSRKTPS
jgi:hypothetical protein